MKEDLITFETAKLAKEKGFKNGSISTYHDDGALNIHYSNGKRVNGDSNMTNGIEAPTQSLLQKWLRETKDIHAEVLSHKYKTKELRAVPRSYQSIVDGDYFESFDSHYEAVENSLTRSLKKL